MKLKSILNSIIKIVFVLCLVLLIVNIFFEIKIIVSYRFFFWVVYFISALFLIFTTSKKFYLTILAIAPIIVLSYRFFNSNNSYLGFRKNIPNTQYDIIGHAYGYRLIEKYYFLEKVVAEKESKIFFNPNSKMGRIGAFQCDIKLLEEYSHKIVLEINTNFNGVIIDSINKARLNFID